MNANLKFQKMWGAGPLGTLSGNLVVAFNVSKDAKLKGKAGVVENNVIFSYEKGIGTQFYFEVEEMKKASEFGFKRFTSREKTDEYLAECANSIKQADSAYKKFTKCDLKSESVNELFKRYVRQVVVYEYPYALFHGCQPQYFEKIEKYVKEKLNGKFGIENGSEIYSKLTLSGELDLLSIEELEWLRILKEAREYITNKKSVSEKDLPEKIIDKIKNHSLNYIYLGTVEATNPWNFNHYMELLNEQKEMDIDGKIEEIESRKKVLEEKKQEILQKNKIDSEIITICDNIARVGFIRLALRFAWTKAAYMNMIVLRELASRKINPLFNKDTFYELRFDEIKDLILDSKCISKEEIDRRKQAFLYCSSDFINSNEENIRFYSGEKAISMKKELVHDENLEVNELRGAVACKGKVRGRVKLFTWVEEDLKEEMKDMKQGDILVAGQTRPFLMPAIKKASAIVTDEGGITSHAAIISRELGIPCIIGTKIGTKILKTGDLIEVDAIRGVVRIIERVK